MPVLIDTFMCRADNYGFHNFEGYPDTHDVGVVILDTPYTPPSGQFGILPEVGSVDEYAEANNFKQDTLFRTSGYLEHVGLGDVRPSVTMADLVGG